MAVLAVVNLPSVTNLPKDAVANQFAIAGLSAANEADSETVTGAIAGFYTGIAVAVGRSIDDFLSGQLSRAASACTVKMYDITGKLSGTPHGSPYMVRSFTLGVPNGGTAMPSEVACVLRLEAEGRSVAQVEAVDGADADSTIDRPKQRHTGRVFIGPLTTEAVVVTSSVPRVHTNLITTLLDRGIYLQSAIAGINEAYQLGVWSRKDATIRPLESFAVDNAFDTQRRRGEAPTGLTRQAVA